MEIVFQRRVYWSAFFFLGCRLFICNKSFVANFVAVQLCNPNEFGVNPNPSNASTRFLFLLDELQMNRLFTWFTHFFTRCNKLFFQNLRVKYYKKGGWISEKKLAEGLVFVQTDWNSCDLMITSWVMVLSRKNSGVIFNWWTLTNFQCFIIEVFECFHLEVDLTGRLAF